MCVCVIARADVVCVYVIACDRYTQSFGALLMRAPFVDVTATMSDVRAPWTLYEFEVVCYIGCALCWGVSQDVMRVCAQEWGAPQTRADVARAMLAYDPYWLAYKRTCWSMPTMLQVSAVMSMCALWQSLSMQTGLRDPVVRTEEHARLVARLRERACAMPLVMQVRLRSR
jgi:protease II